MQETSAFYPLTAEESSDDFELPLRRREKGALTAKELSKS